METLNFSEVGSQKSTLTEVLLPGQYKVESIEGSLVSQGKTPYLKVTFTGPEGRKVSRNFFITAKALRFLQYMHETITDKLITREFKSAEEVANYFEMMFKSYNAGKLPKVGVIVGRKYVGDKTYSFVVDFDFLIPIDENFEEREFTEDDLVKDAKRLIKNEEYQGGEQTSQTNTFLTPEVSVPRVPVYEEEQKDNDLPF